MMVMIFVSSWSSTVRARTDTGAEGTTKGKKQNRNKSKSSSKDKEVNQAARDSDDALVCCVKNTVEDCIMDSGASFHATYCKEELERFKLRSGKVCLADDKTLDIAGVGDVVLKTSFSTSWTLKDVRYIPSLKRRLILVGQLNEEGYHVGFEDQLWKVTKGSLVVAHGNKRGSMYMVEDWYEHVSFQRQRSRCTEGRYLLFKFIQKAMALHLLHQSKDPATMILLSKTATRVANGIMLKMVPKTPLQFSVAERLSRTFRAESTGLRTEAPKIKRRAFWSLNKDILKINVPKTNTPYPSRKIRRDLDNSTNNVLIPLDSWTSGLLVYRLPLSGLRILEEEWRRNDTSLTHLKAATQMKCDTAFRIRRVTRLSEAEISHLWTRFVEPGGSSDTSEGSENSGSFEDSGRSDEEVSEDGAFSEEGGSETPQVRRSNKESRAPVRYSSSANYLLLTENGELESYSEALSSKESVQWKKAIIEETISLEKNQTCSLVRLPAGKKASQSLWMFMVKEEQDGNK
ncbi:retrovirus-related pol polyprotein from transposon TNT 1-94, partial [Tanacetum coccineum]